MLILLYDTNDTVSIFLFSGQKLWLFSFFIRFIASQWLTTLILKLGPRINCLCLTHGDRPKLNKHSYAKRVLITRQYTRSNIHNTSTYLYNTLGIEYFFWTEFSTNWCRFFLKWLRFSWLDFIFCFSIIHMNTIFIKMAWRKIMFLYVCWY